MRVGEPTLDAREPRPGDCQDGGRGHRQPPARAALEADALTPLAVQLDAVVTVAMVLAILVGLIVYETLRFSELREKMRHQLAQ
jgi:hypothetical protein